MVIRLEMSIKIVYMISQTPTLNASIFLTALDSQRVAGEQKKYNLRNEYIYIYKML